MVCAGRGGQDNSPCQLRLFHGPAAHAAVIFAVEMGIHSRGRRTRSFFSGQVHRATGTRHSGQVQPKSLRTACIRRPRRKTRAGLASARGMASNLFAIELTRSRHHMCLMKGCNVRMQRAPLSLLLLLLHYVVSTSAFAQAGYDPPEDVDADTVLGFIAIAGAAVGYWFWKRRSRTDTRSQAAELPRAPAPLRPTAPEESRIQETSGVGTTSGSVFISYRRGDAGDVVGRIYDRLVDRFGRSHVFKDVDSIPLGVDFRQQLSESVGGCRIFLAIISRGWLQQSDGERRIDQSNDFVRIEIEAALQRSIPVIPVLVQGASLPSEQELPDSLRELAYRNATVVRADPDFQADIARLMDGIAFHLRSTPAGVNRS